MLEKFKKTLFENSNIESLNHEILEEEGVFHIQYKGKLIIDKFKLENRVYFYGEDIDIKNSILNASCNIEIEKSIFLENIKGEIVINMFSEIDLNAHNARIKLNNKKLLEDLNFKFSIFEKYFQKNEEQYIIIKNKTLLFENKESFNQINNSFSKKKLSFKNFGSL